MQSQYTIKEYTYNDITHDMHNMHIVFKHTHFVMKIKCKWNRHDNTKYNAIETYTIKSTY